MTTVGFKLKGLPIQV